ncbi:MAG: polysaccharide deacetylase family protein [Lentisphaerae bacterium]|nr:polysaccharide deacetylase family protein [Lentisphaerota bacterium]
MSADKRMQFKGILCRSLFALGAADVCRIAVNRLRPGVVRILSAHRVVRGGEDMDARDRADIERGCLTATDFAAAIRYLKSRYRFVSLASYVDDLRSGRLSQPGALVLTFDDGFVDVYTEAFPLLKEEDIPFTVFVTTDFVGKDETMLSETQIREMARCRLVDWGAHGVSHLPLTGLSPHDAEREITGSRDRLESLVGRRVELFCYPDGKFDDSIRALVIRHAFAGACATGRIVNAGAVDPFELKRIPFESESLSRFAFRVAGMT